MKVNRFGAAISVFATGALLLSGCGSDNNATGGSSSTNPSSGAAGGKVNCGGKQALKASGSSAQNNAMTRFIRAFEQACSGQHLSYTANGSGAGISEFIGNQTDFGGSDSPLSKDEPASAQQRCGGSPAWNLPVVFGPIAVAFNLNTVSSLTLDGPTLAKIFKGDIKTWNDPAIQALNTGFTLPGSPIHVIFRSEESGTTDNFQKYLDAASNGAWGKGAGKKFNGTGEGAKGSEGVADAVKGAEGSISYMEWSFATGRQLNTAKIVTSAGPEGVPISEETVGKTIAAATISGQGNDLVLDTMSFYKPQQPGSYPIVLATYEIVCSKYPDAQVGTAVKAFLQSTIGAGQNDLAKNGYVPIPDAFKSRLKTAIDAIS